MRKAYINATDVPPGMWCGAVRAADAHASRAAHLAFVAFVDEGLGTVLDAPGACVRGRAVWVARALFEVHAARAGCAACVPACPSAGPEPVKMRAAPPCSPPKAKAKSRKKK